MDGFIQISSDSDDKESCNVFKKVTYRVSDNSQDTYGVNLVRNKKFYDLDLSDDDFIYEPLEKRLNKEAPKRQDSWRDNFSSQDFCENSNDLNDVLNKLSQTEHSEENCCLFSAEIRAVIAAPCSEREQTKSQKKSDKESRELEKGERKAQREREKELKKQQKENEKAMKNALKVVENYIKPDQCSQYIIVNIDENIINEPYGQVILAGLTSGGYNYKTVTQQIPKSITWSRKVPIIDNMTLQNTIQEESYHLLILDVSDFITQIDSGTFEAHIQSLLSQNHINHVTIAVLGLDKYYKHSQNKKKQPEYANLPKLRKMDVDIVIAKLQILCKNCYFRSLETYENLALFVGQCTKAVAQAPYKAEKSTKVQQEDEFFQGSNKDCVKIDSKGNGLNRLWSQTLKMFPLANLETSEAIMSVYPTLNSLLKAYERCETAKEKEMLLQEIPIRRSAGPLATVRRIGPELSRKAYIFFCSQSNTNL